MCCNAKFSKCFLIFFNTIFFLIGVACIVAGVFVLVDNEVLTSVLGKIPKVGDSLEEARTSVSYLHAAAYVIIAAGSLVLIIAFCGCFGAIRESKCLLWTYCVLVFVILVIQIAAGIVGYLYKDQATKYMRSFLNDTISEKYEGLSVKDGALQESADPYTSAWVSVMFSLECCGNYNYTDFSQYATKWYGNYSFNGNDIYDAKVPIACCKVENKTDLFKNPDNFIKHFVNAELCLTTADPTYTNTVNCYDKIIYYVDTYTVVVLGVGIGVAVLEIFVLIAACCLIRSIGKDDHYA